MPAVDHERVLLRLKEHIVSKPSHGRGDLLQKVAELEVENEIPEDEEAFDPRPPRRTHGSREPADGRSRRVPLMASH